MKSSGATVGLWKGFQIRNYIYMKRKTFLSRDKVLILGQSLMRVVKFHYHPPLKELTLFRIGNLKIVMPKAFVLILRFNPGMSSWKWKTPIGSRHWRLSNLPENPWIKINQIPVEQVSTTKSLGVYIYQNLNWGISNKSHGIHLFRERLSELSVELHATIRIRICRDLLHALNI